jgi:peroxiredoxin
LRRRYTEIQERGVEVLALAPGDVDQTGAFAAARELPFPCLADPSLEVYRCYEVESRLLSLGQRPALYAVDREGILRYAFLGTQQWQVGDVDEALSALEAAAAENPHQQEEDRE